MSTSHQKNFPFSLVQWTDSFWEVTEGLKGGVECSGMCNDGETEVQNEGPNNTG